MPLTKAQTEAVIGNKYPCFLTAGAGTGKTRVLVEKIGHIVARESQSLKNIAAITFTNKATDEMRERLYQNLYGKCLSAVKSNLDVEHTEHLRLQAEMCSMAQISTIHSFCDRLLRAYGTAIGISPAFRVSSYREQSQKIIEDVYNQYRDNPALSSIRQYKVIELVLQLMNDNNNRGIIIDDDLAAKFDFNADNNAFWCDFKKVFVQVYLESYKKIENEKAAKNILTLNDTIRKTAELLNNADAAARIANQYRYLFIDEFQDVDHNQYQMVTSLIAAGTKVFIVGDEKQSIFRFRGADVQNVSAMKNNMSKNDMPIMEIAENFRSDAPLIDIFNQIFQHNYNFYGEPIVFPTNPLVAGKNPDSTAIKKPFEMMFKTDIVNIVQNILKREKFHGKAVSPADIAILCRNNAEIDRIAYRLKAAGVPAEVFGGAGFYQSKEIIDVYKLLNVVIYQSDDTMAELMFTDFYQAIKLNSNGIDIDGFLLQLGVVLRQSPIDYALQFVFDKSGIIDYYRVEGRHQAIANLNKLKSIAQEKMNTEWILPIAFLDFLEVMIKAKFEEDEADIPSAERSGGFVTVCSVHKAKGLSFPVVIIPNCDKPLIRPVHRPKIIFDIQNDVPKLAFDASVLGDKIREGDKDFGTLLNSQLIAVLEEELRILYVALTRAENKVIALSEKEKWATIQSDNLSWMRWILESLENKI